MKFRNKKTGEIKEWGPILINSALLSAQQRKRYYWTNWHVEQPQDKGILLKDILESDGVGCRVVGRKTDKNGTRHDNWNVPAQQMVEINENPNKSNCISTVSKDSMIAEPITKRSIKNLCTPDQKANCLLSTSWKGAQANGMTNIPERIGELAGLSKSQGNRIYSVRGKSVSLNANGGGGGAKTGLYKVDLPDGDYIIRKLTPVECERLQTLPDGWTEKGAIQWNYASVMGVTENVKLTLDSALCTINDGKDVEQQSCQNTKENNVNFVAELQLQEKCAIGTIRIGNGTKTQNIQIKLDKDITDTAIKNSKENIKSNIENLPQNLLEEIYCQQKWFIILTLIKKTIQEKTYSFAQKHNINKYTLNCKLSQGNSLEMDLSSLKMESIVEISNTQRYKAIGNGWTVDVIAWILGGIQ